jgi:hypothetical protein
MGEMTNEYILFRKHERNNCIEVLGVNGRIILQPALEKEYGLDSSGSGQSVVVGSCVYIFI